MKSAPSTKTVIIIGGPTASGKSGLALDLAQELGGVVINADSMQLYDGLHILTAQPSTDDKTAVPHTLYGALKPDEKCHAAAWRDMALKDIDAALAQNKTPIVAGGTGFYIKTLVEGISPIPDVPEDIRKAATTLMADIGNIAFHEKLAQRDPVMAAKLDPGNTQRLIRAWEVLDATGQSLAVWQDMPATPPPPHLSFTTITLLPPRADLYARCDARFEHMAKNGAIEETEHFMKQGFENSPLENALGYTEFCGYLNGTHSLEDATTKAQQRTRNYAKRQTTWFRHQITPNITLNAPESAPVTKYLGDKNRIC
ncbi:MAG: tRNA (adenosine(37)-N6)-dimethylallyltransferase MiaA [Alphaproteobacteria bacterium]|nr:tRNA (adenosine(37)-N6)-dimethylallyltransferase MiaA [Alphaproteobacteria bacterium]